MMDEGEHSMKQALRRRDSICQLLAAAALALAFLGSSPAEAREYDPFMMYVFPAGGQRGTTVKGILARGRGLEGTSEVRISGKGVTAKVIAIEEPSTRLRQRSANRQDQAENPNVVKFSVTIAPDAKPGPRDLWLITPKGATNRRHFVIGQIPEVYEADDESRKTAPQLLESLPVLVNGQYNQGDDDIFRFTAKAGQTLVFEAQGRTLIPYIPDAVPGWFQPCLALSDSTGKQLQLADDFRFHPDPVLFFHVKKDGEYRIEIRDALFRGREDLIYRLAIGPLPYITHIYPLGGRRNSDVQVALHGVNLGTTSVMKVHLPDDSPGRHPIQVTTNGLTSNVLPFAVDARPETQEAEPNDTIEQANRIETPGTINGRIQKSGDEDLFRFAAKKGQRLILEVRARRLDSPIDSVLTLLDGKGKLLAENDDTEDLSEGLVTHHADSYLNYTFRADGDHILRIRDAQAKGGDEYSYRIVITPPRSDFDLRIVPANLNLAQGGATMAKVKAYRRDGFNGEIRIRAAGLPPGFTTRPVIIPAGQNETRLTVVSSSNAPLGIVTPRFTGTAVLPGNARAKLVAAEKALLAVQGQLQKASAEVQAAEKTTAAAGAAIAKASEAAATAREQAEKAAAAVLLLEKTSAQNQGRGKEARAKKEKLEAEARAATARLVAAKKELASATFERPAVPAEELMQAFYYWQDVPTEELLLAVVKPTSFIMSTDISPTEVREIPRKGQLAVLVSISRQGLQAALARAEAEKKAAAQAQDKAKADLAKAKAEHGATEKQARAAQAAAAKSKAAPKAKAEEKTRLAQVSAAKLELAKEAKARLDRLTAAAKAAAARVTRSVKKVSEAAARAKAAVNVKVEGTLRGITVKPVKILAEKDEASVIITVSNQAPIGVEQNVILTGTLKVGPDSFVQLAPAIPIRPLATKK